MPATAALQRRLARSVWRPSLSAAVPRRPPPRPPSAREGAALQTKRCCSRCRATCSGGLCSTASRCFSGVTLSESRMKEFIRAEVSHFARMSPEPVRLSEIVHASTDEEAARLIHKTLPGAFATRIKHIETLPQWDSVQELREVHDILYTSFHNLRLVDQGPDLVPLDEVIRDLRQRHKAVVPLLGTAVAHLTGEKLVEDSAANDWLDTFLLARISTEMLTAHYIALREGSAGSDDGCVGLVDRKCDPGAVCARAAANVEEEFEHSVKIAVQSETGIEFSFLPQYLMLLLMELLRNSVQATLRNQLTLNRVPESAIKVTVASDVKKVMIKISDRGGGLPFTFGEKRINYSWARWEEASSFEDPLESWREPLAGIGIKRRLGMGIRLIRLYAEYLGGSLHLLTLPNVGTDAYIQITRIEAGADAVVAEPGETDK
eukprot:TRINITY_DN540_c0_g1_i1.p1 TRINITY_DN540_c0_g1~~TRINITY_DN540_c0_g1_i1.p1  ORF type:complete len:433 (+),score=92.39 TRINITY_DN540_c0_g1_i1:70-1368(+)